ncbi:MAG: 5-formyltetrahydrofolate cyclo-ligase [Mariprofundales bacterium]
MPTSISQQKAQLRQWGKKQRAGLSPPQRMRDSQNILNRLNNWLSTTDAKRLLVYRNTGSEVITDTLFSTPSTIELFAPITGKHQMHWASTADSHWALGNYDILEPQSNQMWNAATAETSIIACPMTAFDRHGGRIGMGKGYFDRWLQRFGDQLLAIVGLGFSCQEASLIPLEPHDRPLQYIFTELEMISCH